MRKLLFGFFLLLSITQIEAQTYCLDSLRQKDPYYPCGAIVYTPVCGCDNVTYINPCAAENWGALINNGFYKGYTENTVCGNYDFLITPTAFGLNSYSMHLWFFTKTTGSVYVYIYDLFGLIKFEHAFSIYDANVPYEVPETFDLSYLPQGIYEVIVLFNNEKKFRKIGVVKN